MKSLVLCGGATHGFAERFAEGLHRRIVEHHGNLCNCVLLVFQKIKAGLDLLFTDIFLQRQPHLFLKHMRDVAWAVT